MNNLTPQQAEIISHFKFSIIQQSNIDYLLMIQYKSEIVFSKTTDEICDYWDWLQFPDELLAILFPDCKLEGLLDFNVFFTENIGDLEKYQFAIYAIEERNNFDYQKSFFVSDVLIPNEFVSQFETTIC